MKVLPAQLGEDAQRMARFEREAQLLASLNHPHIAAIHGLEESNGVRALVMELVEGPTLADRIREGPIPLDEALPLARQIAEALEYAHEKGIVHRDLKPANIKLTAEGAVKVLDFGLAKAMADESSAGDPANSPTLTIGATNAGMILGTAGYMSPEQARGWPADKRADIWSFGVVLYEMLAGRRLLAGETVSDNLAAVLKTDPDFTALPEATPPELHRLLRRCLTRDRKHRLQSIGDARVVIEEIQSGAEEAALPTVESAAPRRNVLVAVAAILLAVGDVAGYLLHRPPPAPEIPLRSFSLTPGLDIAAPQISPDGRHVAYAAEDETGARSVWIWDLDQLQPRRVVGPLSSLPASLFWSPDSQFLGFREGYELKKVAVTGGPATTIAKLEGANMLGASWSPDGATIIFSDGSLYQVPAQGGTPKALPETGGYRYPHFLPQPAEAPILYLRASRGQFLTEIVLGDPAAGDGQVITNEGSPVYADFYGEVVYSLSGHVLFSRQGTLWALPFSPETGAATGEPFPIRQGAARPSVSTDGTLVYRQETGAGSWQLVWKSREGVRLGVIGQPQENILAPRLSPDGQRVAVRGLENGNWNIWSQSCPK